ncbi:NUT family member 1 [Crotalus adamanteus]|uniref:NUT family member 1 n=1 Tax=Crotalus adamanteus TaxID=8729 RepID=A0AAW1B6N7_CROAD
MTSQNHTQAPGLSSCPPNVPSLLLPAFPGAALLVTSADTPGSKLIIKLKREGPLMGGSEELPRTQTFFLTGMPLGWATHCRDGPGGPGIRTVLLTKAGEEPGGRKTRAPEAVPSAQGSPSSDTSFACTSKGVYENYRRWQRYKALARRHFPATPDAEALACFFIPVLRSLARLRPNMTLEDGVPRAVQEWEHSSNFERMIFYEMAEKFMEFEAEEEQQIQKIKLLATCSQFQNPVPKPTKPPMSPAPESGHQQVYIPKKSASKSRQPRRRQKRPPSTSNPGAPREIPAEAVHQYAEIMEGLNTSWEEEEAEKKEQGMCRDTQGQEEGVFPDPGLLQYIDQLCDDEEFVCKVEAVIHPQFMADLLSPEKTQDPLDLVEELAEELNLTPSQSGLEKLRESQGPFSDQDKVTPQMEKLPNDQCLKPTLNPSSYISRSEADGENSGPQEVHTSVPTSAFPSPLSLQGNSSHGNLDFNPTTLRSESKVYWEPVTPEKETSNWNQLGGDLVKAVTVMNVVLPDLPGGTMEGVPKEEDEDEEEDEELSSFSSLLASKLNFSPHSDHLLLTTEQGDTLTFSPMDLAKPVKPRHCSRGQLSQNARPLANKNLDVNSSVHRYHKRKSNTTGTRRSKRLRNQ